MRSFLSCTAFGLAVAYLACADAISHSSNIVGYIGQDLNRGWNEIELDFDAVGTFPVFTTLDKVVKFTPGGSMIGDEIVFNLDGYHQKYRVTGHDATTEKFTLTKIRPKDNIPEQISFDWIPVPKVFWINHVTTNSVYLTQCGQIDNGLKKLVDSQTSTASDSGQPFLRIVPVNPDTKELHYTLQGGKIIQQQ